MVNVVLLQAVLREIETQTAIDEGEIRNMELQLQRKLLEQVCFFTFGFIEVEVKTICHL
jgi:hypothetical protein